MSSHGGGGSERSGPSSWRSGNEDGQDRQRDRDRDKNHETVCNMLSMLTCGVDTTAQPPDMPIAVDHRMLLLNMTNSPESCMALRRAGCISLLIEILHPPSASSVEGIIQPPEVIRLRAARALKNIVQFNPDEKMKRKELRVLKLLEGIRSFSEAVKTALQLPKNLNDAEEVNENPDLENPEVALQGAHSVSDPNGGPRGDSFDEKHKIVHPTSNITTLMKLSFDEEHRNTMCLLGAIHAFADLILSDHLIHGNSTELKDECLLLRRYCGMTLTNLTFGDGTNKALLCGMREFMSVLVSQLDCDSEDVCQVTASVLRNLSWHADSTSRAALRESNAVPKLTLAAIKSTKESTLKATLSALWNLSAHSALNKSAICTASPNALPFLVSILRPSSPIMKTLKTPMTIIENAGGILRNVSTQIKGNPELRKVLRDNHCYETLLEHLKSGSLTVVSNACGTLWNLSSGTCCEEDQRKLLDLNAIPMLKSLIYSKHERISQGASAALRNLLSSRFAKDHTLHLDTRLTAQIYSTTITTVSLNHNHNSNANERGQYHGNHKSPDQILNSPGSDKDYDFEFNPLTPAHQKPIHNVRENPQPPFAHQQPSSIFQQNPYPLQLHYHNPPVPMPFVHHRPTTITYSMEPEPLDLSLTSAKSSPIHVISAAEFGMNHSNSNHRKGGSSRGAYQLQHQPHHHMHPLHHQPPFLNPPNILHHSAGSGSSTGGRNAQLQLRQQQNPISMRKFNQSCPEILSRFQSITPVHMQGGQSLGEKPLDFSASSTANTSAASSVRGGGQNGSNQNDCSGPGDTTFNYSLKFSEVDVEDELLYTNEANNSHSTANTSAPGTPGAATGCNKSEDTLKTYCYEGTPNNFSISNSCQDLMQELEFEQNKIGGSSSAGAASKPATNNGNNKLQPIDETPKQYYVEGTPAVFSRTSSLSSINSSGLNGGENKAEFTTAGDVFGSQERRAEESGMKQDGNNIYKQNSGIPKKKPQQLSLMPNPAIHPARVTFSAEETPLMFSRSSSVASLDSLDVGAGAGNCLASSNNDDDLSDFSRRASEVVSPSDLPDSPRAMAPPIRIYEKKAEADKKKQELSINRRKLEDEDTVKVFSVEEKSGLNSCRSLSPLTIDGEVLSLGKVKLDNSNDAAGNGSVTNPSTRSKTDEATEHLKMPNVHVPLPPAKPKPKSIQLQKSPEMLSPKSSKPGDDELKVFAMEGTPFYGVSNATSLSDLMADIDQPQEQASLAAANSNEKRVQLPKNNINDDLSPLISPPPEQESGVAVRFKKQQESHNTVENSKQTTNDVSQSGIEEDPIYSDVQLLQKCIRVGRAAGIPKSKSEFRISSNNGTANNSGDTKSTTNPAMTASLHEGQHKTLPMNHNNQVDDPDLAALIMKGRNKKDKGNISKSKDKSGRRATMPELPAKPPTPTKIDSTVSEPLPVKPSPKPRRSLQPSQENTEKVTDSTTSESEPEIKSRTDIPIKIATPVASMKQSPQGPVIDISQISTTSLGSEWNDETPTFSSPIPSMSISTAFKIVTGNDAYSPPHGVKQNQNQQLLSSTITNSTISMNQELLENIDPPSCFSNLVSSTDCAMNAQLMKQSTISERMNRKWRNLNDANNVSTCSNLSGQRPPPDFDLENSMISVASIKSEIFEMSSATNPDLYQSAMDDLGGNVNDTSLGGNTYTIFPPANITGTTNVVECKSVELPLSEGNTVVSEDFTDAEDIEEFETAPVDDEEEKQRKDAQENEDDKCEKEELVNVDEKEETTKLYDLKVPIEVKAELKDAINETEIKSVKPEELKHPKNEDEISEKSQDIVETDLDKTITTTPKPLMEVHPLDQANRFNTYVVKKPLSPRSSPRQKRREDPDRYKTHTITHANSFGNVNDSNGNPSTTEAAYRFSTFRVSGPRVVKPILSSRDSTDRESISPESTPGNSPKGIRGRRKMLYSSLPPGSIVKKKGGPPPVPPKPSRTVSPARSTGGSVYVRPTRTSELRTAANTSRDSSPGRGISSSRTSSNSSLNLIHRPVDTPSVASSVVSAISRPKIAPKPPVRTTTANSTKPFSGSASNVQHMKTSNSTSFGFGMQHKGDNSSSSNGKSSNMKGYSTLPKSSKLGSGLGDGKENPEGNATKVTSKIGKITNLWRKMEFHKSKDSSSGSMSLVTTPTTEHPPYGFDIHQSPVPLPTRKSSSKFSNFFGRKKEKVATVSGNVMSTGNSFGGVWVRRDGENKALVAPFNYVPPGTSEGDKGSSSADGNSVTPDIVGASATTNSQPAAAAAGSAKITTV